MTNLDKILRSLFALMAFGVFLTFTSCDEEEGEPEPTETIYELIQSTENMDSLAKYIELYPSLTAVLSAAGENTFFAPDNSAFISLLQTPGFPTNISSINPAIIEGVLAYHIVAGQTLLAEDLTPGSSFPSLFNDPSAGVQNVIVNDDGTLFGGGTTSNIEVKQADVKATNGVLHVVKSVLIPPSTGSQLTDLLGKISGAVMLSSDFSILAAGLTKAEVFAAENSLPSLLTELTANKYTVFAPTNATFNAVGYTADTFTGQQWYGIIANHMVDASTATISSSDMTTGATFTTYGQGTLLVFNNTDAIPAQNGVGIYIDSNGSVDLADQTTYTTFDAEVALFDATGVSNGALHVIAGVLAP